MAYMAVIPGYLLWENMSERKLLLQKRKNNIKLVPGLTEGVSFRDNAIIINANEKITVLSAKCTHLGCRINEYREGKLVCPCHGSKYDTHGRVVEGPATASLETLAEIRKPLNKEVIIDV